MTDFFSPAALSDSVHAALKTIPEGHRVAFLLDATKSADGTAAEAMLVAKVNDEWQFIASGGWSSAHGAEGKVAVMWSK